MTQVGINYAQALYDLAKDENLTAEVLQQLQTLQESFAAEPDFLRLLGAPNIPKEERCQILDRSFRGQVHPYVLNFLKILTEKGYTRYFGDCLEAFEQQYNLDNGILPVQVYTAVEMTPQQQEKLTKKLSNMTGKTVKLQNRIDPGCLGGVRLTYDGKQVDGTVKNRLDTIGSLLKNTVL